MESTTLYLTIFIFIIEAFAEDGCPNHTIFHLYKELNCQPIFEGGSKCPTSFNCDYIQSRSKSQCHHKDRIYSLSESIPMNETEPDCLASCKCIGHGEDDSAEFSCAYIECPGEWRNDKTDCRFIYSSLNECCKTKLHCLEDGPIEVTCNYDGETYYEGEKFYPKDDACKVCICKAGFQGMLVEPFCRDIKCHPDLVNYSKLEKCAPQFYAVETCCPYQWICPSPQTRKISYSGNKQRTTSHKCRFGDLILEQYDVMTDGNDSCECLYPPYLTCMERTG